VFEAVSKDFVKGGHLNVAPLSLGAEAIQKVLQKASEGAAEG
jgi:hypothetical protein